MTIEWLSPRGRTAGWSPTGNPEKDWSTLLDADGVFVVPAAHLEKLEAKLSQLNARAARLNKSERASIHYIAKRTVERGPQAWAFYLIGLRGSAPLINGFRFVARLEHHGERNIVTRPDASLECPRHYRYAPGNCEHCGTSRRRSETFVLYTDKDVETAAGVYSRKSYIQVGRNCLADYIRSPNVADAIQIFDLLQNLERRFTADPDSYCERHAPDGWSMNAVLRMASSVIRKHGWVSKSKAADSGTLATASLVDFGLSPRPGSVGRRTEWDYIRPDSEDERIASDVLAWLKTIPADTSSDYLSNLSLLTELDAVGPKNLGLAVSAVQAWRRKSEQDVAEQRRAALPPSKAFGQKGERYYFGRLRVSYVRHLQSDWGATTLIGLVREHDGYEFKWFASRTPRVADRDVRAGDELLVIGRVKDHQVYKGTTTTVITRADAFSTYVHRGVGSCRWLCDQCGRISSKKKDHAAHVASHELRDVREAAS